jgi:hypothetical protein
MRVTSICLAKALCLSCFVQSRTRAGEETLADWLLHPATPAVVVTRHEAILEIKDRLPFRESLFAAGESAQPGIRPQALASWGEQEPLFGWLWLLLPPILTGLWIAAALYFLFSLGNWLVSIAGDFAAQSIHWPLCLSACGNEGSIHRKGNWGTAGISGSTEDIRRSDVLFGDAVPTPGFAFNGTGDAFHSSQKALANR